MGGVVSRAGLGIVSVLAFAVLGAKASGGGSGESMDIYDSYDPPVVTNYDPPTVVVPSQSMPDAVNSSSEEGSKDSSDGTDAQSTANRKDNHGSIKSAIECITEGMNEVKIAAGLFKGALDHLESVNFPILSKFGETVEVTCSCGNIGRIGLGNNIAKDVIGGRVEITGANQDVRHAIYVCKCESSYEFKIEGESSYSKVL